MSGDGQVDEEILFCDGLDNNGCEAAGTGHPKIYLKVKKGETRPCPYCGKQLGTKSAV